MKRGLDNNILQRLFESNLWKNKLKEDCKSQNVFMAIRDNKVGFYHKGGLLFNFNKGEYSTHYKYAAAINGNSKNYLTEQELRNHELVNGFEAGYVRIKENCSKYSGVEALGVSEIYHRHSYLSDEDIVVLDIEVSFESFDADRNQDRIDLLLFNKLTKALQFVEVKHFSNSEIWSTGTPKVVAQINRYEKQIGERREKILNEYVEYIRIQNRLFDLSLPLPNEIIPKVKLLILGFDNDQLNGRLKHLIMENQKYESIVLYAKGDPKTMQPKALWGNVK